jgi:hypothetical protein
VGLGMGLEWDWIGNGLGMIGIGLGLDRATHAGKDVEDPHDDTRVTREPRDFQLRTDHIQRHQRRSRRAGLAQCGSTLRRLTC